MFLGKIIPWIYRPWMALLLIYISLVLSWPRHGHSPRINYLQINHNLSPHQLDSILPSSFQSSTPVYVSIQQLINFAHCLVNISWHSRDTLLLCYVVLDLWLVGVLLEIYILKWSEICLEFHGRLSNPYRIMRIIFLEGDLSR